MSPEQEQAERKAFEAWAKAKGFGKGARSTSNGRYWSVQLTDSWIGWLARASQSAEEGRQ